MYVLGFVMVDVLNFIKINICPKNDFSYFFIELSGILMNLLFFDNRHMAPVVAQGAQTVVNRQDCPTSLLTVRTRSSYTIFECRLVIPRIESISHAGTSL